MIIRKATKRDIEHLVNFQLSMAFETEGLNLDEKTLTHGVEALFDAPEHGQYYVAETDQQVIGSFMITYEWSDWRNGMVWWFQSVYILPEYRGKGGFRKMFEYIKNIVETDKNIRGLRLYVDKTNTHAQKVYTKVGMNGEHYAVFEWMKTR